MLAVRFRGAVERDRHSRELEAVYGAEGTARIGLALERLLAGLDALGVERATALAVVETVAMDSMPPLRRRAYEHLRRARDLTGGFAPLTTSDVAQAMGLPTITVRRALEDLAAYDLVERHGHGQGKADKWMARP
jgi:CRP-like cAMP-binding protein